MRRTMIAAAVAAACCVTSIAHAQSNVTVYGKLYPQITSYSVSGGTGVGATGSTLAGSVTTAPKKVSGTVMESSNSRIGFRGTEKISDNLKAIFQLETAFSVDSGEQGTAGLAFDRNTFVGLDGSFGRVRMGRFDTVYKTIGDTLGFMGVHSGNFVAPSNILTQRGFGTNNADRFHERPANTIDYSSPAFGGFKGFVGYSFGEQAGEGKRGSTASGGVTYTAGPLYLALAHEQHYGIYGGSRNSPSGLRNTNGTNSSFTALPGTDSKDTSTRLTALYKFTNAMRAEANFAVTKLSESGGATGRFEDYKHNNWSLGLEHKIDAWTLAGNYGVATEGSCSLVGGAACSTDGLEGSMVSLGASYNFSKRTALFALYSQLNNGHSARYKQSGEAPRTEIGQDVRQVALGISHSF